jgi:hypothetical protein
MTVKSKPYDIVEAENQERWKNEQEAVCSVAELAGLACR